MPTEGFRCVDFAKNLQIETYSKKYLQDAFVETCRADWRVDMGRTNSYLVGLM